MTTLNNGTAATLRRRIAFLRELEATSGPLTPKPAEWWASMERAAEELERRQEFETVGEAAFLAAIVDNRRIRVALKDLWQQLVDRLGPMERERVIRELRKALNAAVPPGEGRKIFGIEIMDGQTRDEVETDIVRVLNLAFPVVTSPTEGPDAQPAEASATAE